MGESSVIEIRTGRGEPRSIALTPGSALDPTSVGRSGMWRIEGRGVLDVHAYFYYDGAALYVQSADEEAPVLVNKHRVACAWTEVRMPSTIELGDTHLVYRIDVAVYDDGDATVAQAAPDDGEPPSSELVESRTAERNAAYFDPNAGAFPPTEMSPAAVYPSAMPTTRTAPLQLPNGGPSRSGGSIPPAAAAAPVPYGSGNFDDSTRLQPIEDLLPGGMPPPPAAGRPAGAQQIPSMRPAAGAPMMPPGMMGAPPHDGMAAPQFSDVTARMPGAGGGGNMMMHGGGMPMAGPGGPMPPWEYGQHGAPHMHAGGGADFNAKARAALMKAKADFEALPPIKRVLLVMSPFVLIAAALLLFGDDPPPPPQAKSKPSTSATTAKTARKTATLPTATTSTPRAQPTETAAAANMATASTASKSTPAVVAEQNSPPATAADGQPASPGTLPADLPPTMTSIPMPAKKSLERQAADAWAGGSFEIAAGLYDQLAKANPHNPAFKEAAKILHGRIEAGKR